MRANAASPGPIHVRREQREGSVDPTTKASFPT
jgi:hypothetical protein